MPGNYIKRFKRLVLLSAAIATAVIGFVAVSHSTPVNAAVGINEQINYQGRLLTATGAVVPDGTYNMEFKIIKGGDGCNPTSGTFPCSGTEQWTETRESSNKVLVKNGYFSVYLGSVTPFSTSVDWDDDTLWLAINVGGTAAPSYDGVMKPLTRLSSTPYALNTKMLGGRLASQFFQISPGTAQAANSSTAALHVEQAGTGNIAALDVTNASANGISIDVQSNSSSQYALSVTGNNGGNTGLYVRADGIVGIGTTSPTSGTKLTIQSGNTQFAGGINILASTHATSERAAITFDGWNMGQDSAGNGTKDFYIWQASSTEFRFLIDTSGNVGIGDTTPDARLDVENTWDVGASGTHNNFGSIFTFTEGGNLASGSSTSTAAQINFTRGGSPTGGTISSTVLNIQGTGNTGGNSTLIGLNVNVSGADTNYAALLNGGNVGIGTTAPTARFQVNQDGDANNFNMVRFVNSSTGTTAIAGLEILAGNTTFGGLLFAHGSGHSTDPSSFNLYNVNNAALKLGTNNTERLRINGNGTINLDAYDCSGNTNSGALTVEADGDLVCSADDGGGGSVTLQQAYDADVSGDSDIITNNGQNITFTLADEGTDADFLVNLQGTGNTFEIQDSGTAYFTAADARVMTYTGSNAGTFTFTSDLTGGNRSSQLVTISQANDASNSNTTALLRILQSDTDSTGAGLSVTQSSTAAANAISVLTSSTTPALGITGPAGGTAASISGITSGFGYTASSITTGNGFSTGSSMTSGIGYNYNASGITQTTARAFSVNGTASGALSAYTGSYLNIVPVRELTSGSINDTGHLMLLTRSNTVNNAGSTFTVSGDVANISSNCTQTAGTCTDTANILELNQQYASASGAALNVLTSGTGDAATFTNSNSSAGRAATFTASSAASAVVINNTSVGNSLTVQSGGNNVFQITNAISNVGSALFKNVNNNATAFVVQNSSSTPVFTVNTSTAGISVSGNLSASGTITLSGLNCTGNTNGGALTANGSGVISCSDDDSGAGGGDLDAAYDADTDKTLTIDSTSGLLFDMTTTGDVIFEDNGSAFFTINNTGSYSFTLDSTDNPAYTITNNGSSNVITNLAGTGDYVIQDNGTQAFFVSDTGAVFLGKADGGVNVTIGDGSASTTPDLFVLDIKSDAGDPSGTEGAMYYNDNTNKFRCFEGSAWKDCDTTGSSSPFTRISGSSGAAGSDVTLQRLTSNSADHNLITLSSSVMSTTGVGSGVYKFRYTIIYQTAATGTGIAFGVNHTGASSVLRQAMWRQVTTGGAAATGVGDNVAATVAGQLVEGKSGATINAIIGSASAGVATANTNTFAVLEGILVVTNSGTLELKVASEVALSAVRIMTDSMLELTKF